MIDASWGDLLIDAAWKSVLVAGAALLLLALLKRRSAPNALRRAFRHGGRAAAPPADRGGSQPRAAPGQGAGACPRWRRRLWPKSAFFPTQPHPPAAQSRAPVPWKPAGPWITGETSLILYLLPAALLLLATVAAILRLFALRRRASVIVQQNWLTALAHAQRRMGIKSGTALLVSQELSSPVSWGVLRPIILLSEEALHKPVDAEAIIAHELAHVARFDWVNLLVARIATAMFWFNPLVWLLARQGISCARKRRTTQCCAPTFPTPIMPRCWSAPPATRASRCCWPPTASPRARGRCRCACAASSSRRCAAGRPGSAGARVARAGALLVAGPLAALTTHNPPRRFRWRKRRLRPRLPGVRRRAGCTTAPGFPGRPRGDPAGSGGATSGARDAGGACCPPWRPWPPWRPHGPLRLLPPLRLPRRPRPRPRSRPRLCWR
jgi:hypothetical protein